MGSGINLTAAFLRLAAAIFIVGIVGIGCGDVYVNNDSGCKNHDINGNPDAPEICDGLDNNCDDVIDEGVQLIYYLDGDGDGFGTASSGVAGCESPATGYVTGEGDCDDANSLVHPDATETCNGIDDDCDALVDADDPGVTDATTYYSDVDGDGSGDGASSVVSCSLLEDFVTNPDDCADQDASVNPLASETCDGIDQNCDDLIDEGVSSTWYSDSDADGFGNPDSATVSCDPIPGLIPIGSDCNDEDSNIYPDALERCNELDDDCDAQVDEAEDLESAPMWYYDGDGDGYGSSDQSVSACSAPDNYVGSAGDCDDGSIQFSPASSEVCDDLDNNCDGQVDEGVLLTWYQDSDGDGFGTAYISFQSCSKPEGYVAESSDCDDLVASTFPGAHETCNDVDDDCDGVADDGLTIIGVAGGDKHSLALCSDGIVLAWGDNAEGQLGNGTTQDQARAKPVPGLSNIAAIEAGKTHSVALDALGTIWTWGNNDAGQLGDGTYISHETPQLASEVSSMKTIAAGHNHTLALTRDGYVYAWGENEYGQIGTGSTSNQPLPMLVPELVSIIAIAAGEGHSLALQSNGKVFAWGLNHDGQLGNATTDDSLVPLPCAFPDDVFITAIAAGAQHSLAADSLGTVWTWGENTYGKLGDGETTRRTAPGSIGSVTNVEVVRGGSDHSAALTATGEVWTWGYNANGELGNGTNDTQRTPGRVESLTETVLFLTLGGKHNLISDAEGRVKAWGDNSQNQLGDGSSEDQFFPISVGNLP